MFTINDINLYTFVLHVSMQLNIKEEIILKFYAIDSSMSLAVVSELYVAVCEWQSLSTIQYLQQINHTSAFMHGKIFTCQPIHTMESNNNCRLII